MVGHPPMSRSKKIKNFTSELGNEMDEKITGEKNKLTFKATEKKVAENLAKAATGYEVTESETVKGANGKTVVKKRRKHVPPDPKAAKALLEIVGQADKAGKNASYKLPPFLEITENEEILVRTSKVCELFQISDRTLSTWSKNGAPQTKRGWWNIKELFEWRLKTAGLGNGGGTTKEAKKLDAEARLKEAKANIEEIRLQKLLEQMVPIDLVEETVCQSFATARSSMLSIGEKVFIKLNSQYPEVMQDVRSLINHEIEKALEQLSADGADGIYNRRAGR